MASNTVARSPVRIWAPQSGLDLAMCQAMVDPEVTMGF